MKTLADLPDGVLAITNFPNLQGLERFRVGNMVFNKGRILVGHNPSEYVIAEVLYPIWQEVLDRGKETNTLEAVLIQCLATISSHPGFTDLTPEEIFDKHIQFTKEI